MAPDINVDVRLSGLTGVSRSAEARLRALLQQFADEVAREASRLEEGERLRVTDAPELTARMVEEAYQAVKRPRTTPAAPTRQDRGITAGHSVSGLLSGVMLTMMHSYWQVSLATASALVFAWTTYLQYRRRP